MPKISSTSWSLGFQGLGANRKEEKACTNLSFCKVLQKGTIQDPIRSRTSTPSWNYIGIAVFFCAREFAFQKGVWCLLLLVPS